MVVSTFLEFDRYIYAVKNVSLISLLIMVCIFQGTCTYIIRSTIWSFPPFEITNFLFISLLHFYSLTILSISGSVYGNNFKSPMKRKWLKRGPFCLSSLVRDDFAQDRRKWDQVHNNLQKLAKSLPESLLNVTSSIFWLLQNRQFFQLGVLNQLFLISAQTFSALPHAPSVSKTHECGKIS